MNFEFSEEQKILKATIRNFAEREIRPIISKMENENYFPYEIIKKLGQLGMLGGYANNIDTISSAIIIEEISRISPAIGVIISVHNTLVCNGIFEFGTEEQKRRYLPDLISGNAIGAYALTESQAGSNPLEMNTSYKKVNDKYIINGRKIWITNGPQARYILLYAVENKNNPKNSMTCFIIDTKREGFQIGIIHNKLGLKGSYSCEIILDNYTAYKDEILGNEHEGYKIAMKLLTGGRIGIAAQSLGLSIGAYELALNYSKQREQFGKKISEFQIIQYYLSEMITRIYASRLLTYYAAYLKDKGQNCRLEASMAKLYASETANFVVDRAVQIFGSLGYAMDFDIQRYYRDARVLTIYEGTSEIQRIIIAREILK
ncbi:MAG: acyl-CoA dehydrogenase family protein [candidate division WOR-3 bacterium]|jgi:alkylation response protein AidB-like acyl-CoA dehydrogenase